ncbi:MAG: hypothetical protein JRG80_09125 [Deltaproteobacteria bacterium]|nr:hypothetical protein [Deltaproteobacteria bacterium]MBW2667747.1 hypothetical protein [Deltaproteobacteria bacterium]
MALLLVFAAAGVSAARGRGADGDFEKRESSHFVLFQDVDIDQFGGFHGSRRFEQQVLDDLEASYRKLDQTLGLRPSRKIDVVIYDPAIFDQQFASLFRFAAAGFYSGIIRIRGSVRFSEQLSRVLAHELFHAALDAATPSAVYPAWFNEGMAEWFEARIHGKRHLTAGEIAVLRNALATGQLFAIDALGMPSFSRMSGDAARLAYVQSYALMEFLARRYGERSLREFCVELVRTGDLRRTLRRVFRSDLQGLEAGFIADLN